MNMFAAAQDGAVQRLQDCLAKGGDPSQLSSIGSSPLHAAILAGKTACVQVLLEHSEALGSQPNKRGKTPLALAAQAAENLSTRGFRLDLEPRRVLLPTSEEHAGPLPLPPHCALGPCREGAVVLMCV